MRLAPLVEEPAAAKKTEGLGLGWDRPGPLYRLLCGLPVGVSSEGLASGLQNPDEFEMVPQEGFY